ncbi:MAG: YicC family protein [Rhodocyclaceae bacterium]|nr:YicC family protein [Rhodocyclaceae bacterium]
MIYSMTGFAAGSRDLGFALLNIELKSVNSRYLDLTYRIGDELRFLEMPMRELIAAKVQRGKLECRVFLQSRSGAGRELQPNMALVAQLGRLAGEVRGAVADAAPLTVAEILRWPGVLADEALDADKLHGEALALLAALLADFVATRGREGARLESILREKLVRMREGAAAVAPLLPKVLTDYQDRLAARLREAVANLDEDRIRQELGVFAARIDVAEELARLTTHIDEVERVLGKGGAVGKRLDFLMQELNREANTLASKSVSTEITAIAMELKLLVEQMREQVQNLE